MADHHADKGISDDEAVVGLVGRWAQAEERGDVAAYADLLTGDFQGVGPVGFVLDADQWASRFRQGLRNDRFAVLDPQVRRFGDAALVLARLDQATVAQGRDATGSFRVLVVCVRDAQGWRIAHVQLSGPLTVPGTSPGPPPGAVAPRGAGE